MASVLKVYAAVTMAGLVASATKDLATRDAMTTGSAKTEHASVHRVGTENIALCVSNKASNYLVDLSHIWSNWVDICLAGCPNSCSRHGQCLLEDGVYHCSCGDSWAGTDCSIALEMSCSDSEDNDDGKAALMKFQRCIKTTHHMFALCL